MRLLKCEREMYLIYYKAIYFMSNMELIPKIIPNNCLLVKHFFER